MVEYVLGGALALAVVGWAVGALVGAVRAQGINVRNSVDAMPPQPNWP